MEVVHLKDFRDQGTYLDTKQGHHLPASMAGTLPDWATTPRRKGWYVQTIAENTESTDHAADDKPGIFMGRNGQVIAR